MTNALKVIIKIIPISEITKPAIDKPLGVLNTPMKENRNPKNQTSQPINGSVPMKNPTNASTKPAVPIPFDLDC